MKQDKIKYEVVTFEDYWSAFLVDGIVVCEAHELSFDDGLDLGNKYGITKSDIIRRDATPAEEAYADRHGTYGVEEKA